MVGEIHGAAIRVLSGAFELFTARALGDPVDGDCPFRNMLGRSSRAEDRGERLDSRGCGRVAHIAGAGRVDGTFDIDACSYQKSNKGVWRCDLAGLGNRWTFVG